MVPADDEQRLEMAPTIRDLEVSIRDLINIPWKQSRLLRTNDNWYKLCSSLDVIGDSELALHSFDPANATNLSPYIGIYGVMQLLFVQQDAVAHLAQALNIEYTRNQELWEIRDLRNVSTGHPTHTSKGLGRISRFSFIVRPSVTPGGFQIMTTYSDGRQPTFRRVSLPVLIESQRAMVCDVLTSVRDVLAREDADHKGAFMAESL
jgi:hypothetical protein